MKKFLTYLLLLLFTMQSTETAWIILNFKIHQDYFAKICTNKDKPEMHCNGKCHLQKQIQQQEEQEEKKEQINLGKEHTDYLPVSTNLLPKNTCQPILAENSRYRLSYQLLRIFDIFHPPKPISSINI